MYTVGITVFTLGLVATISLFCAQRIKKHDADHVQDKQFIIKYPPVLFWIFLISLVVLFTITMIVLIMHLEPKKYEIFIMIIPGFLFALLGFWASCRYRVVINFEKIEYTPVWGKTKIFNFSDITKVVIKNYTGQKYLQELYYVYVDNKRLFVFDDTLKYSQVFMSHVREKNILIEDMRKFKK